MITQKQVTIDGINYTLSAFPATRGLRIMKELTKLVGPSFAAWAKGEDGIAGVVTKLVENLDAVNVETLVKEIVSGATKDNMSINFDIEFAGNYMVLFKLVKEVIEFNFGGVFTNLGSVGM